MRKYILTIDNETIREVNDTRSKPVSISVQVRDGIRATMGELQRGDIGKQVFKVGDIYQVENDEQRDKRTAIEARNNLNPIPNRRRTHVSHVNIGWNARAFDR